MGIGKREPNEGQRDNRKAHPLFIKAKLTRLGIPSVKPSSPLTEDIVISEPEEW
jgi:hypothetical protein